MPPMARTQPNAASARATNALSESISRPPYSSTQIQVSTVDVFIDETVSEPVVLHLAARRITRRHHRQPGGDLRQLVREEVAHRGQLALVKVGGLALVKPALRSKTHIEPDP